ncbi:IclR family transcriptional regulator [Nocardioides alcanivorans]|uniref:IclR family transcriptional regulator n=1 Tax=Nocardioides alcanivorans TaxID=2897352 RepID=UPI001F215C20|nr:IclR family transcriptional regulator [Nocardioides alcanivorans]
MDAANTVIGRASALLRALAQHEPQGLSTTTAATVVALARPTVHRLLTALQAEGLSDRDRGTGQWHLGPEAYLLGQAASSRHDETEAARPVVRRLARETGESAFFSALRGEETVCLIREDGDFPIRSHVLHEGIRFPLGVASAGMALLAFLDNRSRSLYLDRVDLSAAYGDHYGPASLRRQVAETRRRGFSVNPGLIVEGSWGLGAAVFDGSDTPVGR